MRILILGAGGIGGYFGGRLAAAGFDVAFLVRPARAEALRRDGLVIHSPLGDARVEPRLITRAGEAADLVLLSCKAYDLDEAIVSVRGAVGEGTTILPLLNGLAHLDRLDSAFGAERVLGGLAHISATLGDGGVIRHLNTLQTITYGARTPSQAERCASVAALLDGAPFDVRTSTSVMQDMWDKFTFITAAGAIACLMRASVRDIMATDDGERLTRQMLDECNAVATFAGYGPRDKARAWAAKFLTDPTSDFKPSMLQDVERGGRTEFEHLQGDMLRRAAAAGLAADGLRMAFCQLQADAARKARAGSA
jgi:2-dehydropantoate 2-reductase